MGIFSFFGKKRTSHEESCESPGPTTIEYTNILDWFTTSMGDRVRKAQEDSKHLISKTQDDLSAVLKSTAQLEKAAFESGDNTYTAANMVKDTFVKKTYSTLHDIQFPKDPTYAALKQFHEDAKKSLKDVTTLSPKQTILLSRYFKEESAAVVADMNQIQRQLSLIAQFLNGEGKLLKTHEELRHIAKEQDILMHQLTTLSKKEDKLTAEIRSAEEKQQYIVTRINTILEGEEFKKLLSYRDEIDTLKHRAHEIEHQVNAEINSIKRPIKKLEYETKEPRLRGITNPFRELIMEDREHILAKTLHDVMEQSHSGSILLKDREREKIITLLNKNAEFTTQKNEYTQFLKTINERDAFIRNNFAALLKKKEELELELSKERNIIDSLKSQQRAIADEIQSIKQTLNQQKDAIEKRILESSGRAITINYNI